jgi:hypothetical protein
MSRGYEFDERDKEPQKPAKTGDQTAAHRRAGGDSSSAESQRGEQRHGRNRDAPRTDRRTERVSLRAIEKWHRLSDRERATLREVGRFRTIDAGALFRHRYAGRPAAFQKEITRLQQQGLLLRRSISVGKNRDTLVIVALTEEAAHLVRQDSQVRADQAIYAGFVKPAEVPHDAAIYQMYQAEAAQIEGNGGRVHRVVLDYELKKEVYSKLAKERDAGALEYARRQQETADEHGLPVVDGRIALPDLRIEYETPGGDLDHVDLELATEHYHRGHMDAKARTGFKMYGFLSTSRGRRAQWEGRELTANVLSL